MSVIVARDYRIVELQVVGGPPWNGVSCEDGIYLIFVSY